MGFYDGVAPGVVALDGRVHQPQAKAHIEHISTSTTDSLQTQQSLQRVSRQYYMCHCTADRAVMQGVPAIKSPQGSHISMTAPNEGPGWL